MKRTDSSGMGPRPRKPRSQVGTQVDLTQQHTQLSFDAEAFDNAIRSQGVRLTHHKAIPDPTGMISKGDTHAVQATRRNSDGFLYFPSGTCQVLLTNNPNKYDIDVEGSLRHASAYFTLPRTYEDTNEPIIVHPYDRFYLHDVEIRVVTWQFVESNSTGVDRLSYPAICVEMLVDANGIEYKEGVDFEVTKDGDIKWLTQKRPGWNIKVNRGTIYSIRYRYVPFFVAVQLIHEIRVAQISNPITLDRSVERMPYAVHVVREHVFHDTNRDPNKPLIDHRYQDAPPVGGSLGPK